MALCYVKNGTTYVKNGTTYVKNGTMNLNKV